MKFSPTFVTTVLLLVAVGVTTKTQSYNLLPVKDNTIYSEGDSSNGKGIYLFTGTTNTGAERRTLIQFDLTTIPSDDSIISANLQLYVSKTISGEEQVKFFKLSHAWGEGISDAKFEEGGGATARDGDATWNYSFFDTATWNNHGGDYGLIPSDSVEISDTGTYNWSGNGIISDIRHWLSSPDQNFGWILITDSNGPSTKRFNSVNNTERQPLLIIQTLPHTNYISRKTNDNIKVFPNPSSGEFTISVGEKLPVESIKVIDITGKEIRAVISKSVGSSPSDFRLFITQKGSYLVVLNNSIYARVVVL